jgi:hypothetical protein
VLFGEACSVLLSVGLFTKFLAVFFVQLSTTLLLCDTACVVDNSMRIWSHLLM